MNPFYSLFGRSPIKPIKQQMKLVVECSEQLLPFLKSVYAEDWVQAEAVHKKIVELEQKADSIKKEIRQHLPKGLFLPVPRSDLVNMLRIQDKIANKAKDIAGIIIGRKMRFPEEIKELYEYLILKSLETTNQSLKAINELDQLLETGFGGKEVDIVADIINNLDNMEHDTDEIQVKIRNKLYKIEKELSPVDVMFLYQIISWTGDLADQAQRVGGQLQLLIAN
jgi:predicted phosphate transport protein (TIGR00153 family)